MTGPRVLIGGDWVDTAGAMPILVVGPVESVPSDTPAGTVIVRMAADTGSQVGATVTVWNGSAPPASDTAPPGPVTGLHTVSVGEAGISLGWTNPADSDLAAVVVRRASGSTAPATVTAGAGVALDNPTDTSVTDSGLLASTTYSYSVFTVDVAGNTNTSPATLTAATTAPAAPGAPEWGNTTVLDEQWSTLDTTRWGVENSTYGSEGNRVQRYRSANVVVSAASSGGTGNSLKLVSKREFYIDRDFTAGMIGSRDGSTPTYYPRYGRYEIRHKIPHGQGIWPAFWLRHRSGSSVCEVDIMEYFESQVPGRLSGNLHRTPSSGASLVTNLNNHNRFFEAPNVSYQATGDQWHVTACDILPWTATTVAGGTYGAHDEPSANVLFRWWLNGTLVSEYVDKSAYYWSSLYDDNAFDICLQGSQLGGTWNGHPDDPPGYSRWLSGGRCILSGTAPDACTRVSNGITNLAPVFPSTYEIDYVRVYQFTGAGVAPGAPVVANSADGGSGLSGSAVTVGNSGGASGDAFSAISGTVNYTTSSPLVGAASFTIPGSPASSGASVGWASATLPAMPLLYGRMYVNFPAYPTSATGLLAMGKDANSGAKTWQIGLGTAGAMRFGVSSYTVDTSPVMALNTTYRLEWKVDSTAGTAEIRVYTLAGALHASNTATFTPTAATRWASFGRVSTGSGVFVAKFDNVALSATGWLGA